MQNIISIPSTRNRPSIAIFNFFSFITYSIIKINIIIDCRGRSLRARAW